MSTASQIDIYNMALGFIGTRTVSSVNDRTPETIQCNLYWDRARRAALRDYPYPFAQTRVELTEKTLPTGYESWQYCYAFPSNALKVSRVDDGRARGRSEAFEVGYGSEGSLVFTNISNAVATCTIDVEDITFWDELFVMAIAYRLAMLIAVPLLKNNSQKIQELSQLYQALVPLAEGQAASEQRCREELDAWLKARGTW